MRLTSGKRQQAGQGQNNALNIPVRVTGFTERNNETGAVGKNLLNGEDITVFLTNKGKAAENTNRNSLEKLKNGYKIGKTQYKLEAGGIVSFRQCSKPENSDVHFAAWPNVVAHNAEDAKEFAGRCRASMLRMFQKKIQEKNDDGSIRHSVRHSGTLYTFMDDPKHHIQGNDGQSVQGAVAQFADNAKKPAFLIRVVNDNGEVANLNLFQKTYNSDEKRDMTGEELSQALAERADELLKETPGTLNIVPANRLDVSPKGLQGDADKKGAVDHFKVLAKSYIKVGKEGEIDIFCKDTFYKKGGDNKEFVNDVYPVDPFGKGQDPALLGGLKYTPELAAANGANDAPEDNNAAEQQQADAPAEQEAPPAQASNETTDDNMDGDFEPPDDDDPFVALDGEDFDDDDFPGPR